MRKAIVAAVDPNTFNERVQGGFGEPGTDMFASWSQWHGSVAGNGFDPEAAKKYLAEAKADGYDGKLTYVGMNDPATQRTALTFQSLLQAVGFTVDITYATSINDLISMLYAKHDYERVLLRVQRAGRVTVRAYVRQPVQRIAVEHPRLQERSDGRVARQAANSVGRG